MDMPCKTDFRPSAVRSRPARASESTAGHPPDSSAQPGARKIHRWLRLQLQATSPFESSGESGDTEGLVQEREYAGNRAAGDGVESAYAEGVPGTGCDGYPVAAFRELPPEPALRSNQEPT